jgi:DNA invertase Pin-like site-specific DNA recombinase
VIGIIGSGTIVKVGLKLDRLSRLMAHRIGTVRQLEAKSVGFRSLTEGVDTTTLAARWSSTCSARSRACDQRHRRSAGSRAQSASGVAERRHV